MAECALKDCLSEASDPIPAKQKWWKTAPPLPSLQESPLGATQIARPSRAEAAQPAEVGGPKPGGRWPIANAQQRNNETTHQAPATRIWNPSGSSCCLTSSIRWRAESRCWADLKVASSCGQEGAQTIPSENQAQPCSPWSLGFPCQLPILEVLWSTSKIHVPWE